MTITEQDKLLENLETAVNKMKKASRAKYAKTKRFINATYDVDTALDEAFPKEYTPVNFSALKDTLMELRIDVHSESGLQRTSNDERTIEHELSDILDGINYDIDEVHNQY